MAERLRIYLLRLIAQAILDVLKYELQTFDCPTQHDYHDAVSYLNSPVFTYHCKLLGVNSGYVHGNLKTNPTTYLDNIETALETEENNGSPRKCVSWL